MSDDLISRQAAIALAYRHWERATWYQPVPDDVDAVDITDLKSLPSIHSEQQIGRWIKCDWLVFEHGVTEKYPSKGMYCSVCRKCFEENTIKGYNFCPNCGAFMKG